MASSSSSASSVFQPRPRISARTCSCSPTTHPGSFRCSLHRNARRNSGPRPASHATAAISANGRLDSSLQKSLRAILLQIIRPSNQNLRRRRNFHPRPSRFSVMSGGNSDRGVTVS